MPIDDLIQSLQITQDFFKLNPLNDDLRGFYLRNQSGDFIYANPNLYHMLNIPGGNSDIFVDMYIDKMRSAEEKLIKNNDVKSLLFLSDFLGDYKLVYINTSNIFFKNENIIITYITSFAESHKKFHINNNFMLYEHKSISNKFPIDSYKNMNPSLHVNENEWVIVWLYLYGISIRNIGAILSLSKHQIERVMDIFFTYTGLLNKENLYYVSEKYRWLDIVNLELYSSLKGNSQLITPSVSIMTL